jgi:hypothetical protein
MIASSAVLAAGTLASPNAPAQQPPAANPKENHLHVNLLSQPQWLCEEGFKNTTLDGVPGFQVQFRMVPYRAEPLSCVYGFDVSVDGEKFDPKDMILILHHTRYRVPELLTKWKRWQDVPWWFELDTADVFIPRSTPLSAGEHTVVASIIVRAPFATAGRGHLMAPKPATKALVLETL